MWPESVEALRGEVGRREIGLLWKNREGGALTPAVVSQRFKRACRDAGVPEDVGFYGLRRLARTLMDRAGDPIAADLVMGHQTPGMGPHYVQSVEIERVRRVVDSVRAALTLGGAAGP